MGVGTGGNVASAVRDGFKVGAGVGVGRALVTEGGVDVVVAIAGAISGGDWVGNGGVNGSDAPKRFT